MEITIIKQREGKEITRKVYQIPVKFDNKVEDQVLYTENRLDSLPGHGARYAPDRLVIDGTFFLDTKEKGVFYKRPQLSGAIMALKNL